MSREYIAKTLKRLRVETGLTADEVGALVGKSGKTVNAWENNRGQPDADMLLKLCDVYKVDDILSEFRQKKKENAISAADLSLIGKYNNLDPHGKEIVDGALSVELKRIENERKKPPTVIEIDDTKSHSIKLPYYDLPASAGTGEYPDEYNHFEYIYVPESENALRADYVMRVSGDSMKPKYYEGDKLLVKYTEAIDPGQIGIFVVNNERYVKKCGNGRLISLNPGYEDIIIGEFDEVRCEGKVIGKL